MPSGVDVQDYDELAESEDVPGVAVPIGVGPQGPAGPKGDKGDPGVADDASVAALVGNSATVTGTSLRTTFDTSSTAAARATTNTEAAAAVARLQNLFLGHERCGAAWTGRRIRRHVMEEQAQRVLESLSVKVRSLTAPVSELSGGLRQGIAICRALISDPAVVLLDEPTAALGVSQRAEVLDLVGRLREQGRGVVVISHDMKDVQKVADRIVALRLGSKVAEFDPKYLYLEQRER